MNYNFILISCFFILIVIGSFLEVLFKSCSKNLFRLGLLFASLLIVFRNRGWDYELYKNMYINASFDSVFNSWTEPGLIFLFAFLNYIYSDFIFFEILYAIFLFVLMNEIIKFRLNEFLCFALLCFSLFYFFRGPYGQIRQFIVAGLFFYSLRYLDKEPMKYVTVNLVGLLFHGVSLFAFLFYFFCKALKIDKTKNLIIIFLLPFPFLIALNNGYLDSVINKFTYYVGVSDGRVDIYRSYIFLKISLLFVVLLFLRPRYEFFKSCGNYIRVYIFGCLVFFLLFKYDVRLASRSAEFFIGIDFLLYATLMKFINLPKKIFLLIFVLVFGIFLLGVEFNMMKDSEVKYVW